MNSNIIYVMSGAAHLPYLVASLYTLRKSGNHGLVTVHAWPESIGYVRHIAKDKRLRIECVEREPALRRGDGYGGNAQFLDKIQVAMMQHCDVVLYLDADTTIHGDLTPLMEAAYKTGFCATQWNDWKTNRGHAKKRINGLLEVKDIPNDLVKELSGKPYPSVNGGVWATVPSSPVLPLWYDWTKACKKMFISDERVLHLMMARFPEDVWVLLGGRWNCSPKFQPMNLRDDNVVVRHYHGDSNVRPNKSVRGVNIWYPIYAECLKEDIGGINCWIGDVKNKWMDRLGDYSLSVMCG
jgi:hypothetical protein